jgi:hypothetical protein
MYQFCKSININLLRRFNFDRCIRIVRIPLDPPLPLSEVGLIWTDLLSGRTDLHRKGVFISPFLSLDWSIWKYCGVVGLICNLREFLWGGATDCHFKGVFICPFLSFWLVNLKLLTIRIGFLLVSLFAAGDVSPWKLRNSCKAVFRIPVYEGFS